MIDELVTGLLPESGLRILIASTGGVCRKGRDLHQMGTGAAAVFAQGLTAGLLMASLQKERSRVNVQLECDGPLRGMFVDASSWGTVRGYVKNVHVGFTGSPGAFEWRPVLGNSGFMSILRDRGEGDFYRSSIELKAMDVAQDLERYFDISEQLRTAISLEAISSHDEPLKGVFGVLLQLLPNGDRGALDSVSQRLRGQGLQSLVAGKPEARADALLTELFGEGVVNVLARTALSYACTCSRERVLDALAVMGRAELEDVLAKEGKAETTCEFCMTRYDISGEEIQTLLGGGASA